MSPLSTELEMLLWSALLYIAQILIPAAAADLRNGVRWGLGNRDEIPPSSGWEARAERAYRNMAESLLPFACVVIALEAGGLNGAMSALGATVFLFSRLTYAVLYLAGVTVLRSIAYMAGLIGIGLVVYQMLF